MCYPCSYVDELLYWSGRRMILDEYLQGDLTPSRLQPSWVTTKKYVFQSDDGALSVLDTATNTVSTLATNHTLRQLNVQGYQCSYDLRYVLFRHNVKKVFATFSLKVFRLNTLSCSLFLWRFLKSHLLRFIPSTMLKMIITCP